MHILAVSVFCPENIFTNEQLIEKYNLDSSNEWIVERTGISKRHICDADTCVSDMAVFAAKKLQIEDKSKIKVVIVATSTHDKAFPSAAVYVHKALGLGNSVTCFDVNDACNGFVQAVSIAQKLIQDTEDQALVIGADKMSQITDWTDRNTAILFGDGAGAILISADDDYKATSYTLSEYTEELYADTRIVMNGAKVFKFAVNSIISDIQNILQENQLNSDQISFFVPHQANSRIIESIKDKLNLKDVVNVIENYGNTSAASIPIAINSIFGDLNQGDLLLLSGFAAGFRGGSVLVRR